MQVFTTPDFLQIAHRTDLDFLVVRWLRSVTGAETRLGYQLTLDAAVESNCPYWLLDGRRRSPADEETTRWGLTEFFPSLSSTLGRTVCMSHLLSPFYKEITEALPAFHVADSNSARTYLMGRFNDETRAVHWLQEQQALALPQPH